MRWTLLGAVTSLVVQVPYAAAMSRLLEPSDFGLVGLGIFMIRFVSYFAQGGLNSAVTQRAVLEARDVRAAVAFGIAMGVGVYAVAWAITPLAVQVVNGPPKLIAVCRGLGLTFVISAIGSTATGLLRRAMRYRTIALLEFGSYLFGYCGLGVTSAVMGCGVWSLVYASVAQCALMALGSCALAGHDLRPLFDLRAMKEVGLFGVKVSFVGFLEFLTLGGDNVLIGRYAGMEMLGYYNRAWLLAALPLHQVAMSLNKVLLPAFSSIQAQGARLKSAYTDSVAMTTLLFLPMGAVIAASSTNAIHVVLGADWAIAAHLVPPLAVVGTLNVITYFPAAVAEATGRVWQKAAIESLHLITLLAGAGVVMLSGAGILGLVTAVLVSRLVQHAAYIVWIGRVLPGSLRQLAIAYAQSSAVALVIWSAVTTVGHLTAGTVPALAALAAQLITAALLGVLVLVYGRTLTGMRVAHQRALIPSVLGSPRHPRKELTNAVHRKE
ncbi:oligosaccharide flippase family protein [Streptomyces tailanensis]|uniref:oligosaccharide flippase family protein n=1 Tax=Streptomyces tailanensis TaxID=2569858 RepID=UPI00155AB35E|nr:oligosaccharide flippase family protein [Streptomyces tailanensis]